MFTLRSVTTKCGRSSGVERLVANEKVVGAKPIARSKMIVKAIKTRKFMPPQDNLWKLLETSIKQLEKKSIVVVTSKIVSIGEGRCVPITQFPRRDELVVKEADWYLPRTFVPGRWFFHTIKNNLLISSAGIDKSNAAGFYILWPKNAKRSAEKICKFLRQKFGIKELGVIITDSHIVPFHRGLVGFSLAYFGFKPLRDYRGRRDIFGKKLIFSQTNIPDSLAAAAVLVMGEGREQTPITIISNLPPSIRFTQIEFKSRKPYSNFEIPIKEDAFRAFFKSVPWEKGEGGYK